MDWSLLFSSYGSVFGNLQVILMTFIGALGGVLLGAIPGMTATMGVALLIPFSFGMDLMPSIGLLLGIAFSKFAELGLLRAIGHDVDYRFSVSVTDGTVTELSPGE